MTFFVNLDAFCFRCSKKRDYLHISSVSELITKIVTVFKVYATFSAFKYLAPAHESLPDIISSTFQFENAKYQNCIEVLSHLRRLSHFALSMPSFIRRKNFTTLDIYVCMIRCSDLMFLSF